MKTVVFPLADILAKLGIDPNASYYLTVANHKQGITEPTESRIGAVRYQGQLALTLTDEAFIIGHQNMNEYILHYKTSTLGEPLIALGNVMLKCIDSNDREAAMLLDYIDFEFQGQLILNLDDPLTLEGMQVECPEELDDILNFFNNLT